LNLDKSPNRTQQPLLGYKAHVTSGLPPRLNRGGREGLAQKGTTTADQQGDREARRRRERKQAGAANARRELWQPGGGASLRPAAPCCALLLGAQKHGRGRGASASAGSFSDDLLVVVASTVIDATPGRPAKGSQRKQPDPLTARSPRAHTIRCLCCFCAHWQIAFFPPTHFRAPRLSLSTSICSSSRPLFFGVSTS
jgi:hypothetical protein